MTPLGIDFLRAGFHDRRRCSDSWIHGTRQTLYRFQEVYEAEGGVAVYVWMPKELKEQVAEKLNETAKELYGIDNFTDMIGDETIAEDPETLVAFLTEKGHPALGMDPMM